MASRNFFSNPQRIYLPRAANTTSSCQIATQQANRLCSRVFENSLASNAWSTSGFHHGVADIIGGLACRQALQNAQKTCAKK